MLLSPSTQTFVSDKSLLLNKTIKCKLKFEGKWGGGRVLHGVNGTRTYYTNWWEDTDTCINQEFYNYYKAVKCICLLENYVHYYLSVAYFFIKINALVWKVKGVQLFTAKWEWRVIILNSGKTNKFFIIQGKKLQCNN